MDEHGEFYQFEDFKEKFDVKVTFLHYQSLLSMLRRIPTEWKNILNSNRIVSIINRFNVKSNFYMQQLFKDKKGCRRIYDIIVGANEFLPQSKWEREIGIITEQQWENYNDLLASIKEIKLKDFQYKIMNKIRVMQLFLYTVNKVDDNACEYCHQQPETIYHLFVECEKVKAFWANLMFGYLLIQIFQ